MEKQVPKTPPKQAVLSTNNIQLDRNFWQSIHPPIRQRWIIQGPDIRLLFRAWEEEDEEEEEIITIKKKKQKKNKKGKWREDVFRMVFPSKHFAVGRLLALSAVTFHWIWWIHLMPSGCTVSFTLKGKKTRHLNRLIHWINQTPRRWVKIWKMNFIENTATNVLNALLRMQSIKLITFNDEIGFRYGKCAVSSNISLAIQRHLQVEISPLTSQLLCFHGFIFNSLRIPAWNVVNPTNSWIGA